MLAVDDPELLVAGGSVENFFLRRQDGQFKGLNQVGETALCDNHTQGTRFPRCKENQRNGQYWTVRAPECDKTYTTAERS